MVVAARSTHRRLRRRRTLNFFSGAGTGHASCRASLIETLQSVCKASPVRGYPIAHIFLLTAGADPTAAQARGRCAKAQSWSRWRARRSPPHSRWTASLPHPPTAGVFGGKFMAGSLVNRAGRAAGRPEYSVPQEPPGVGAVASIHLSMPPKEDGTLGVKRPS
jgi:hypothetical protein